MAQRDYQFRGSVRSVDWACPAFQDTIARDSMVSCMPHPSPVMSPPYFFARRVSGTIAYLGFYDLPYHYDLSRSEQGEIEVTIRIHFTGSYLSSHPDALVRVREKLARASRFWTENSPARLRMSFRFLAVSAEQTPHFTLNLYGGWSRYIYMTAFADDYTWHAIAHEIGHMLGLDDEYNQIRNSMSSGVVDPRVSQCDETSLMCTDHGETSRPLPYHYYLILRRMFCHNVPTACFFRGIVGSSLTH